MFVGEKQKAEFAVRTCTMLALAAGEELICSFAGFRPWEFRY